VGRARSPGNLDRLIRYGIPAPAPLCEPGILQRGAAPRNRQGTNGAIQRGETR
jgi:hypothetical protein